MPDSTNQQVAVSSSATVLDTLGSLGRQLVLIAGAIPVLIAMLGARDVMGIVRYFQSADGSMVVAAVVTVATAAYGLFSKWRRARQLKDAALNPANRAVTLK
jgi:hypothetical protein